MHMVKTDAQTRASLQASHRKRAEMQKHDDTIRDRKSYNLVRPVSLSNTPGARLRPVSIPAAFSTTLSERSLREHTRHTYTT